MCSQKWLRALGPDAVDAMREVVGVVAARSFFAMAEPCDDARFAALSREAARWFAATVQFTEGACHGTVSCTLSEALARELFDAFAGRDPGEPPPDRGDLHDLVGEFTNIVCGSWLTRLANHQTFTLVRPAVSEVPERAPLPGADAEVLLTVNDLPLSVEVRLTGAGDAAPAGAGA